MSKRSTRSAGGVVLALLLLTVFLPSCAKSGGASMRPEDKLFYYEKEGSAYLASAEVDTAVQGGADAGDMNVNTVPLSDGSMYFIEDGVLYYKTFYEEKRKIAEHAERVFFAGGAYYYFDADGSTLFAIQKDQSVTRVLADIAPYEEGRPTLLESGLLLYALSDDAVWRLPYGDRPFRLYSSSDRPRFINADGGGIYFYADGALWYAGSQAISATRLIDGVASVPALDRLSNADSIPYVNSDGELCLYRVAQKKSVPTGLKADASADVSFFPSLPANGKRTVVVSGEACYLSELDKTVALSGVSGTVVAADGGTLYFLDGADKTITAYDAAKGESVASAVLPSGETSLIDTPTGAYLVCKDEASSSLYRLYGGSVELLSGSLTAAALARPGYGYRGLYYLTDKGIEAYDETTGETDLLLERSAVADFLPRMGGVIVLYADGRLVSLRPSETVEAAMDEGVSRLYEPDYRPYALRTYR